MNKYLELVIHELQKKAMICIENGIPVNAKYLCDVANDLNAIRKSDKEKLDKFVTANIEIREALYKRYKECKKQLEEMSQALANIVGEIRQRASFAHSYGDNSVVGGGLPKLLWDYADRIEAVYKRESEEVK